MLSVTNMKELIQLNAKRILCTKPFTKIMKARKKVGRKVEIVHFSESVYRTKCVVCTLCSTEVLTCILHKKYMEYIVRATLTGSIDLSFRKSSGKKYSVSEDSVLSRFYCIKQVLRIIRIQIFDFIATASTSCCM
jgi:hypothetical protein